MILFLFVLMTFSLCTLKTKFKLWLVHAHLMLSDALKWRISEIFRPSKTGWTVAWRNVKTHMALVSMVCFVWREGVKKMLYGYINKQIKCGLLEMFCCCSYGKITGLGQAILFSKFTWEKSHRYCCVLVTNQAIAPLQKTCRPRRLWSWGHLLQNKLYEQEKLISPCNVIRKLWWQIAMW